MKDFYYDDRDLQRLFVEMEPKRRLQALKGGFRKEAMSIRKVAIKHLRDSIRSDRDLERGIRPIVFKKKPGFRVTIGTKQANRNGKGEAGFHMTRRGVKKPVLIWAEEGTEFRQTKKRLFSKRKRHSTGRMRKYGFMEKTLAETQGSVTENLHKYIQESVIKTARKYGCK